MPAGGYSRGLAEPEARSVQEISEQGGQVTFTWFDPPFRPEPPHSNQAYGICFTGTGLIVLAPAMPMASGTGTCSAGGSSWARRSRTAWYGK